LRQGEKTPLSFLVAPRVEEGKKPAVLFVDAVFQPERHDIVHEVVFVCFFPVT